MATSTTRRADRAKPASAKKTARPVKTARAKPAVRRRPKAVKARRAAKKPHVGAAASAVLHSFVKLLKSVRSSAAHLTTEQRAKLQKAMKHAHAALD